MEDKKSFMTIEQFIEKAIEGGYPEAKIEGFTFSEIILDPKAWEAVVGIMETEKEPELGRPDEGFIGGVARRRMVQFVGWLFDGLTIQEALAKATI